MTKNNLSELYFHWLCQTVAVDEYSELCRVLHDIPFQYSIDMDGNRESDGIDFRYRFGMETGLPDYIIASQIDILPCSVLEMMVALANRIEEQIMTNTELGNRTGEWFRKMIFSLHLEDETNGQVDRDGVETIIFQFMHHRYKPNGSGGLFTLKKPKCDMRTVEIWYQMQYWLSEQEESE